MTYISEVMYNPEGNDNNKEYIEIFSNDSINLTDYFIEDFESTDELVQLQSFNGSYSLIVEEGFNYSGLNVSIYSVGSTIGNNLNNEGDIVLIKNKSTDDILDIVIYDNFIGGDGNGKSICRNNLEIFQNSLIECNSSAGSENMVFINNQSSSNQTNNSNMNNDFSTLKINEFIPNPEGNDNAPLPNGEWIELFNSGESSLNIAGLKIYDNNDNKISISSLNTLETTLIQPHGFLVVYGNGNSILNNNGFERIILKNNEDILDEITYFDSIEGKSYGKFDDVFKISEPTPGFQNTLIEQNTSNSSVERQTSIRRLNSSFIEINKIYLGNDGKARFGDTVKVKINVYKGNTRKTSGNIYIVNVSESAGFNLYNSYINYTLTLPISIAQNCDNKLKNGTYRIIAESFGIKDHADITIDRNKNCVNYANIIDHVKSGISNKSILSESFINYEGEGKKVDVLYKSRDEKVGEYAVYFFIISVILILGYFLLNHERKHKS